MKDIVHHSTQDPYMLLERAISEGWSSVDTIPISGEGEFLVVTLKGLVRLARSRAARRICRRADGWGPKRSTVVAVETGNYLGAIAWKWP